MDDVGFEFFCGALPKRSRTIFAKPELSRDAPFPSPTDTSEIVFLRLPNSANLRFV